MPELPEVETVRRGLTEHLLGARIGAVDIFRGSVARRQPGGSEALMRELRGSTVTAVVRRGKFLWCELDQPSDASEACNLHALVAHLGMSGQFRVQTAEVTAGPHVRARLHLVGPDGARRILDFADQRTFGFLTVDRLVATADGQPGGCGTSRPVIPLCASHIARDMLDPAFSSETWVEQVRRRRTTIKSALLDQTLASGVGNIYADEALWRARTHPQQPTASLSTRRARSVLDAARTVMADALAVGGTSFDALYVNVNGESGYFDRSLNAYGRTGQPCARCGTPIRRIAFGGRSSHFCLRCQRKAASRNSLRAQQVRV